MATTSLKLKWQFCYCDGVKQFLVCRYRADEPGSSEYLDYGYDAKSEEYTWRAILDEKTNTWTIKAKIVIEVDDHPDEPVRENPPDYKDASSWKVYACDTLLKKYDVQLPPWPTKELYLTTLLREEQDFVNQVHMLNKGLSIMRREIAKSVVS